MVLTERTLGDVVVGHRWPIDEAYTWGETRPWQKKKKRDKHVSASRHQHPLLTILVGHASRHYHLHRPLPKILIFPPGLSGRQYV